MCINIHIFGFFFTKRPQAGIIKSPINEAALLSVDRRNYVLPNNMDYAYEDSPQPIGYGATISAPHMRKYKCRLLNVPLCSPLHHSYIIILIGLSILLLT